MPDPAPDRVRNHTAGTSTRPTAACTALAVVLTGLLAGCGTRTDVVAHGPAPTAIPWTGPVFVLDYEGRERREPGLFDLTKLSTFDEVTWRHWGGPQAVGTGWEVDFACLNGCAGEEPDGYRATIVLSGLVRRRDAAYYSQASVTPFKPLPAWAENVEQVTLQIPDR